MPKQIRTFTAVDLDRTVLNTTRFFEHYVLDSVEEYYREQGELSSVKSAIAHVRDAERTSRNAAFDFMRDLDEQLQKRGHEPLDVNLLAERILDANRDFETGKLHEDFVQDVLASGALELLRGLEDEPDAEWAFMTYGGDLSQQLKIAVVGAIAKEKLGISPKAMVITTEHKGKDIQTWYDEKSDRFIVPREMSGGASLQAEYVRLIDDKDKNLALDPDFPHKDRMDMILAQRAELSAVERRVAAGKPLATIALSLSSLIDNEQAS